MEVAEVPLGSWPVSWPIPDKGTQTAMIIPLVMVGSLLVLFTGAALYPEDRSR